MASSTSILDLPDLALSEIFLNLHSIRDKFNVELVCKRWRDIGPKCWSNITELSASESGRNKFCTSYEHTGEHDDNWRIGTWRLILHRTAKNLRSVTLCLHYERDEEFFIEVSERCEKLTEVSLLYAPKQSFGFLRNLMSNVIKTIFYRNCNLKKIHYFLNDSIHSNYNFVEDLYTLRAPYKVEELVAGSIYRNMRYSPRLLTLSTFHNLKILNLPCVRLDVDPEFFDNITNLERLGIVTLNESTINLVKNNRKLKFLHVEIGGDELTEEVLQALKELTSLQVLVLKLGEAEDFPNWLTELSPTIKAFSAYDSVLSDDNFEGFFSTDSSIEIIKLSCCAMISLQLLEMAKEWVERTGNSLELNLDSHFVNANPTVKTYCTDNFKITENNGEWDSKEMSMWSIERIN